jgi:osmotically-inducible protein OsmY
MKTHLPPILKTILAALVCALFTGYSPAQNQNQNQNQSPSQAQDRTSSSNQTQPRTQDQTQRQGMTNESLAQAIQEKLKWDSSVSGNDIEVKVEDGTVTLQGEVSSYDQMRRAAMVARSRSGVRQVINSLTVSASDMSDDEIRTQVQGALEDDSSLAGAGIKSQVSDGKVTLIGEAENYAQVSRAERTIGDLAGVRVIDNQITVSSTTKRTDDEIRQAVERRFQNDAWLDDSGIDVAVNDGTVRLSGTVGSAVLMERARDQAQRWATNVDTTDLKVSWQGTREQGTNGRNNQANQTNTSPGDDREPQTGTLARSDEEIREAIRESISEDGRIAADDLKIEVENGQVTLSGQVRNRLDKTEAARQTRGISGVASVTNNIEISSNTTANASGLQDRVSRALKRNSELRDDEIRCRIEAGTATLMGSVDSTYEKNKAESIVSGFDSVREVDNQLKVADDAITGFTYYEYYGFPDYSYSYESERDAGLTDEDLKESVENEFFWSWSVDGSNIDVRVDNGTVTLIGEVDDFAEKQAAAQNAREAGAVKVKNNLIIAEN